MSTKVVYRLDGNARKVCMAATGRDPGDEARLDLQDLTEEQRKLVVPLLDKTTKGEWVVKDARNYTLVVGGLGVEPFMNAIMAARRREEERKREQAEQDARILVVLAREREIGNRSLELLRAASPETREAIVQKLTDLWTRTHQAYDVIASVLGVPELGGGDALGVEVSAFKRAGVEAEERLKQEEDQRKQAADDQLRQDVDDVLGRRNPHVLEARREGFRHRHDTARALIQEVLHLAGLEGEIVMLRPDARDRAKTISPEGLKAYQACQEIDASWFSSIDVIRQGENERLEVGVWTPDMDENGNPSGKTAVYGLVQLTSKEVTT